MSFKETLKACENAEINVYEASIANEVDYAFSETGGRDRDDFEWLCEMVEEADRKVEATTSLAQIAQSLKSLLENRSDPNSITCWDIIHNIKY